MLIKKYFIFIGSVFNLFLVLSVFFVLKHIYSSGLSLPIFSDKLKENLAVNQPNLYRVVSPALSVLAHLKVNNHYFREVDLALWSGIGASKNRTDETSSFQQAQHSTDHIKVSNSSQLLKALKSARAGQKIILAPGHYYINSRRVDLGGAGTVDDIITVTALQLGTVKIFLKGEGFVVNQPYWQFSNLHLIGNCQRHSQCEHAFHVVGQGQHTVIKNNILQDFNAMIKVNGLGDNYPDYGHVTENTFFNTTARYTTNPVTPFDLMHANNWQVSDNFIFDIQKSAGDKVSYAAFFKGGSELGVFERNLVICAANLSGGHTALGLSLGGGGSLQRHRRNKNSAEHVGGIIRHNIIMHCANDVGIYVNRSSNSLIEHNTLYNTLGIDIRYPESDAVIRNNVISGRIKIRNEATIRQSSNMIVGRSFLTNEDNLSEYFVAPDMGNFTWKRAVDMGLLGSPKVEALFDFCGRRPEHKYVGAYSASDFCLGKLNIKNSVNVE